MSLLTSKMVEPETEKRLRHELEFLKHTLENVNYLLKYDKTLRYHCSVKLGSIQFIGDNLLLESELNKTKMMLIREIGQRRKNMNALGIKSRFPKDR